MGKKTKAERKKGAQKAFTAAQDRKERRRLNRINGNDDQNITPDHDATSHQALTLDDQKITSLRDWFTDKEHGDERLSAAGETFQQKGTVILKILKNSRAANKHPDLAKIILTFAELRGFRHDGMA